MKKLAFTLTISFLLLFTNGAKGKILNEAGTQEAVTSDAVKSNQNNAADFAGKLDELLTLEMAVQVSGFQCFESDKRARKQGKCGFWRREETTARVQTTCGKKRASRKTVYCRWKIQ
jgi:hypothetical protein